MKCSQCATIMQVDGNMIRCSNCGHQLSALEELHPLELKYGKEPKISAEELAQTRWNWH